MWFRIVAFCLVIFFCLRYIFSVIIIIYVFICFPNRDWEILPQNSGGFIVVDAALFMSEQDAFAALQLVVQKVLNLFVFLMV